MEHMHRPLHIREKGRRADLVTEADRASEAVVVRMLHDAYPDATILGEEGGTRAGSSRRRWIVDPLDGTTNYAHGYPIFCIAIAFEEDAQVRAGVVYAPMMNELFSATLGGGAFRNGERIGVSTVRAVSDAMCVTGFKPYDYETNARFFAKASDTAQAVRRDGAAALDFAYTAMGRFDAFWEFGLEPWDMAAGALLVREAGGTVTGIGDEAFSVNARSVLASNGLVHGEIQELFAPLLNG